MNNAAVYGALALILRELQKINTRLDNLTDEGEERHDSKGTNR